VRLDPHLVHENVFRNEYWDSLIPKGEEGVVLAKFWEMAREEGFEIPHEIFRLGICVAHFDDDIVVDPSDMYILTELSLGILYTLRVNLRKMEQWNLTVNIRVIKLEMYGGENVIIVLICLYVWGCRFFAVLENKGFYGIDCRRKNYEEIVKLIRYFLMK